MKVEFCTSDYTFSHGRMPRGFGCWAFQFFGNRAEPEFAPGPCSLAEAKKWAKNRANQLNVSFVKIAP